jgi:hypothetical protein
LNDYVTLFVQRGRPTHVVEVSPQGKVLLELHAGASAAWARAAACRPRC